MFLKRQLPKPKVNPNWVDLVFKPVFVELAKKKPNEWWPVMAGNARQGDPKMSPPSLMPWVDS
jgi:hypothetical protein